MNQIFKSAKIAAEEIVNTTENYEKRALYQDIATYIKAIDLFDIIDVHSDELKIVTYDIFPSGYDIHLVVKSVEQLTELRHKLRNIFDTWEDKITGIREHWSKDSNNETNMFAVYTSDKEPNLHIYFVFSASDIPKGMISDKCSIKEVPVYNHIEKRVVCDI